VSSYRSQEPEIEAERKKRELERKAIDDLVRERDILNKNCGKVQAAVQTQLDLLRVNENTKHNLEMEISGCRNSSATLARTLKRLQVEKQRYATDVVEAQSKYAMAVEEVKSREISVLQLQKKIAEGEARMKQQHNLYEAVRSDRNIYSKKLIEDQDEITEMKRKFKVSPRGEPRSWARCSARPRRHRASVLPPTRRASSTRSPSPPLPPRR